MKKYIIYILLIVVFLTGCGEKKENVADAKKETEATSENLQEETKTYGSYTGTEHVTFPADWSIYSIKNGLNKNANLEVVSSEKAFVLISEDAKNYSYDFNKYISFVYGQNDKLYQRSSDQINVLDENGNIRYLDYTADFDGTNVYLRSYVIKGKKYHQIIMWGLIKDREVIQKEFDSIVKTFSEA